MARWGWATFGLAVPLALGLEALVGLTTAAPAASLFGTYASVVAVGVAVPGVLVGAIIRIGHSRFVSIETPLNLLFIAVMLSAGFGYVWVNRAGRGTYIVEAVMFVVYLVWRLLRARTIRPLPKTNEASVSVRPGGRRLLGGVMWVIVPCIGIVAGTVAVLSVKDPLAFSFKWNDESAANNFVPEARALTARANTYTDGCYPGPGLPVLPAFGSIEKLCPQGRGFYLTTLSGWSLSFDAPGAGGVCERHLDGSWWESYGGTEIGEGGSCPVGLKLENAASG